MYISLEGTDISPVLNLHYLGLHWSLSLAFNFWHTNHILILSGLYLSVSWQSVAIIYGVFKLSASSCKSLVNQEYNCVLCVDCVWLNLIRSLVFFVHSLMTTTMLSWRGTVLFLSFNLDEFSFFSLPHCTH